MKAVILDGKHVAQLTEEQLSKRVETLKEKSDGRTPVLATILVGDDPASATYVKMKGNACRRVGMESMAIELPASARTNDLLREIEQLNQNPDVHGILLQHPVPSQIDERACFDMIALKKDVDGVTCLGFGRMAMGEPAYGCATPQGIMRLLAHYEINLEGLHAVVIGRSPILGKPMAMMMLEANATVTICHSRTRDLESHVRQADLVVGAVGRPEFIRADHQYADSTDRRIRRESARLKVSCDGATGCRRDRPPTPRPEPRGHLESDPRVGSRDLL